MNTEQDLTAFSVEQVVAMIGWRPVHLVARGMWPGRKGDVWHARMGLFSVEDAAASLLLDAWIPEDDLPALHAAIPGAVRGRWDVMFATKHQRVWTSEGPFTSWGTSERRLWMDGRTLVGPGFTVHARDVLHVERFYSVSLVDRGVRLVLRDGSAVVLDEEHDAAAALDPTYDFILADCDAGWALEMARAVAQSLGVPAVDGLKAR